MRSAAGVVLVVLVVVMVVVPCGGRNGDMASMASFLAIGDRPFLEANWGWNLGSTM